MRLLAAMALCASGTLTLAQVFSLNVNGILLGVGLAGLLTSWAALHELTGAHHRNGGQRTRETDRSN